MGVEDLLQKHMLLESDIGVIGERVKVVNSSAQKFVDGEFPEAGGNLRNMDYISEACSILSLDIPYSIS